MDAVKPLAPMLNFVNLKDEVNPDALRAFIRNTGIGCNGVKVRFADGIQHHGTHIRRRALPKDMLAKLDSGMGIIFYHNIKKINLLQRALGGVYWVLMQVLESFSFLVTWDKSSLEMFCFLAFITFVLHINLYSGTPTRNLVYIVYINFCSGHNRAFAYNLPRIIFLT